MAHSVQSNNKYIVPTKILKRSEVELFEKNPRTISKQAREKLKKSIKKYGLVDNLVFNQRTGRIVGGHQRISILDEIYKNNDYEISCNVVDLDETDEIKLNIILNNTSLQGEYDVATLARLIEEYDINIESDLLFDKADIDYMFSELDFDVRTTGDTNNSEDTYNGAGPSATLQKIKQAEKEQNDRAKIDTRDGENRSAIDPVKDDYTLTFVFQNNKDKRDFMAKIKLHINTQSNDYLPAEYLVNMLNGQYALK